MSASATRNSRLPFSLIAAGLLFGIGFRAGEATALDGGDGRCTKRAWGELVEVSRVEGTGELVSQTFWRRRAVLTVDGGSDGVFPSLAIVQNSVESEDDILFLEGEEDAP